MPLTLDEMLKELARYLAENACARYSLDGALAHAITIAYQKGMADGDAAVALARDMLDPERYGHSVTEEIRNAARRALGIAPVMPQAIDQPSDRLNGATGKPACGAKIVHVKLGAT